jgi:hypothetical protein
MKLPPDRGPISHSVAAIAQDASRRMAPDTTRASSTDAIFNEDLQLALFILYELHYRGFEDVDPAMEWNLQLLGIRKEIENLFLDQLRSRVTVLPIAPERDIAECLFEMTADTGKPSLAGFLARDASIEQFKEFVIHRSAYHLKEADPYTWVIPRLTGESKSAMADIQADEYGSGRPERMHSELFRATMRALGLDDGYGAYIQHLPAVSLAVANLSSMFGLHRELRGALVGHFSALEMTSSVPNRKYGNGLRRLGLTREATWFFDEHVEADAVHEQLAVRQVCVPLAAQHPGELANIIFGLKSYLFMEDCLSQSLLGSWEAGRSSLAAPC